MSSAIWAEPGEPPAAHPQLGTLTVPAAALATAAGRGARTRVVLRVWGESRADQDRARDAAHHQPESHLWEITDTIRTGGERTTIPHADPAALAQGAHYGWAWAVYPEPDTAPEGDADAE